MLDCISPYRLPSVILMMGFMTPTSTCMATSHMDTPYQDLPLLLMTTGSYVCMSHSYSGCTQCVLLLTQHMYPFYLCSTILIEPQCVATITKHGDVCIKVCMYRTYYMHVICMYNLVSCKMYCSYMHT